MKEHKKIRPEAFLSFRIVDNLNLPENVNYNMTVSYWPSQDHAFSVENVKTKNVEWTEGLVPEQRYSIKVC